MGTGLEKAFTMSPPSGLFVSQQDKLKLSCYSSVSGLSVTLRARIIDLNGEIIFSDIIVRPSSDRSSNSAYGALPAGWIVGMAVVPSALTVQRGQVFVRAGITRGVESDFDEGTVLISDYLDAVNFPSWPGSVLRSSLDGQGNLRSIAIPKPTVGTEWVDTVDTNARWRVLGARFDLTTDANVANRRVSIQYRDDSSTVFNRIHINVTQPASTTNTYSFIAGSPTLGNGNADNLGYLPTLILDQGFGILTNTDNLQVGDQFDNIQLYIEEWLVE